MTVNIKRDTSNKRTYEHSVCGHCGHDFKKPYDIQQEIKKILDSHSSPLHVTELKGYLENGNYDELEYYIKIDLDHLQTLLRYFTDGEILRYIDSKRTYYMTRTYVKSKLYKF